MFFATDEINKNHYLLPNMSLKLSTAPDLCQDTLGVLDRVYAQQNNSGDFINYICGKNLICHIELTGPSWKTFSKLTVLTRTPEVRECDTK